MKKILKKKFHINMSNNVDMISNGIKNGMKIVKQSIDKQSYFVSHTYTTKAGKIDYVQCSDGIRLAVDKHSYRIFFNIC